MQGMQISGLGPRSVSAVAQVTVALNGHGIVFVALKP
jgi:hypothetical protein